MAVRLLDYARELGDAVWELAPPDDGGLEPICRHAAWAVAMEFRRLGVLVRCPRLLSTKPAGKEPRHILVEVALSSDGWQPAGDRGTVFAIDWVREQEGRDIWKPITGERPFRAGSPHAPWLLSPMATPEWYTRMQQLPQERRPRRSFSSVIGDFLDTAEGRFEHFPGDPAFKLGTKIAAQLAAAGWGPRLLQIQRRRGIAPAGKLILR